MRVTDRVHGAQVLTHTQLRIPLDLGSRSGRDLGTIPPHLSGIGAKRRLGWLS